MYFTYAKKCVKIISESKTKAALQLINIHQQLLEGNVMEANMESIKTAQEKFAELIQSEFERIERMKADKEITDFSKLDKIVIGVLPGDGIGPIIMKEALKVLNNLLAPEIASGHVEIRVIEGMTIENRAAKLQSLPDDVFEEIKKCNVIIKGPMVTP